MKTLRFSNYEELSAYAANEIVQSIKEKPTLTLCLASGHTPLRTAELLVKQLLDEKVDYSRISFFGLDEWVGLPPENEGSCFYFFKTKLFEPLQLPPSQYHLLNAMAEDLDAECKKMDALIDDKGGIDVMLVGIGMNGHIGFNEPGTPFNKFCHIAELDDTTKTVGQKYFKEQTALHQGITIGLGHLMNAKKVFLKADGKRKAEVIQKTVEGDITESFPASIMQQHANGFVIVDEEAASLLTK
ncbi:MAG TPA: glucosamine-6-phosphate deaminase [Ferruginibacter sp.]|jgi:glucosamine-6-phosphate isomerase|nr:glucosamine-6-phosphate deaminase [Ferruginibacter sp.]HPH89763.1 glucosamine-6-phosphate deaminase [Ferruginibacter sp.]